MRHSWASGEVDVPFMRACSLGVHPPFGVALSWSRPPGCGNLRWEDMIPVRDTKTVRETPRQSRKDEDRHKTTKKVKVARRQSGRHDDNQGYTQSVKKT